MHGVGRLFTILAFVFLLPQVATGEPQDYDIPNGHFFSQAVPSHGGLAGFMVANGGGIPFWDEYRRLGGWERLGYPISRRFTLDNEVEQVFERGVLRWIPKRLEAQIATRERGASPPAEALVPEPGRRERGVSEHQPGSIAMA